MIQRSRPFLFARLFSVAMVVPFLLVFQCALTSENVSQTITGEYYDPTAADANAAYFTNVKNHFRGIGLSLPDDELRQYTAVRYISSDPPLCQVYVGTQYMGRTGNDLYFKPGLFSRVVLPAER